MRRERDWGEGVGEFFWGQHNTGLNCQVVVRVHMHLCHAHNSHQFGVLSSIGKFIAGAKSSRWAYRIAQVSKYYFAKLSIVQLFCAHSRYAYVHCYVEVWTGILFGHACTRESVVHANVYILYQILISLPFDGGERELGSVHRDSPVVLLNQYDFPFGAVAVSQVGFDGAAGDSSGKPKDSSASGLPPLLFTGEDAKP